MAAFTKIEQEAIILKAVWEMIDDMVNYEMFVKNENVEDITLMFETGTHMRLFNILLGDFLSIPQRRRSNALPFDLPEPPSGSHETNLTFLFYMREICKSPTLNTNATAILKPVDAFIDWLEGESFVEKVWLPSISLQLDMRIKRITYLKICGDIGKHNFARLQGNVRRICRILAGHGHPINEGSGYTVLPEFFDWFHRHVFGYHYSTIAEFLNNIRWGIYDYLKPEFERSFEWLEPHPAYKFSYPVGLADPLARQMYWDLMNMARSEPYFAKFTVTPFLKRRY